jgi:hypothetical protein
VPGAEGVLHLVEFGEPVNDRFTVPILETLGLIAERLDLATERVQRLGRRIVRGRDLLHKPARMKECRG